MSDAICDYAKTFIDRVPMPFGSGNCDMPSLDCQYEGDADISDSECGETCPGFKPDSQYNF